MDPSSSRVPLSNDNIDVSVSGLFSKKMTFKSGKLTSTSFKVYNSIEALFKNNNDMLDFKSEDGKIYHLDRSQVESFLDHSKIKDASDLSIRIVQQMKNDHPIIQEIKDIQRIYQASGRTFKTNSGQIIRLYDNKGPTDDYRIKRTIIPKLTLQGHNYDDMILINKSDYQEWVSHIVNKLEELVGREHLYKLIENSNELHHLKILKNPNSFSYKSIPELFVESRGGVINIDSFIKDVGFILKTNEADAAADAAIIAEQSRLQKEKEAEEQAKFKAKEAEDLLKINQLNKGYKEITDKILGSSLKPAVGMGDEIKNYRSYDLKDGAADYVMTEAEAKEKAEREKLNREYKGEPVPQPAEEKQVDPQKSPMRHKQSSDKVASPKKPNDNEEPREYVKPEGPSPRRH